MLLLLLTGPGGSALPAGIDFRDLLADLYPMLGAQSEADLVFWDQAELYRLFDESAKRLAAIAGLFVERDNSLASAAGTRTYTLPARHVSTIQVTLGAVVLRAATVGELEARDTAWRTGSGTPTRWYADGEGLAAIALYKVPTGVAILHIIEHEFPTTIAAATPTLSAPSPVGDYFTLRALGEARGRESDGAMPEVAAHCRERARLYEEMFKAYWGAAQ